MSFDVTYNVETMKFEVFGQEFYTPEDAVEYINSLGKKYDEHLEQEKLDELSAERNRQAQGGGVTTLNVAKDKYRYDSALLGINDLYSKMNSGDKEARSLIDRLWDLSIPRLREIERDGVVITSCPKCSSAITDRSEYCEVCGADLSRDYRAKGVDI